MPARAALAFPLTSHRVATTMATTTMHYLCPGDTYQNPEIEGMLADEALWARLEQLPAQLLGAAEMNESAIGSALLSQLGSDVTALDRAPPSAGNSGSSGPASGSSSGVSGGGVAMDDGGASATAALATGDGASAAGIAGAPVSGSSGAPSPLVGAVPLQGPLPLPLAAAAGKKRSRGSRG